MVYEVNDPRGVHLALEDLCCPFECCHSPTHSDPPDHIHFQAYVLHKPTESMVAENVLGADLLSECGVFSAWNENRDLLFSVGAQHA